MSQEFPDLPTGEPPGPTSTTGSSSSSSSSGPSQAQIRAEKRAMERLRAGFLESLRRWGWAMPSKNLLNLVEKAVRGLWSTTQFLQQVRHTPDYHKKFAGIRVKDGMTEGTYLQTFAQYQEKARDIGENITKKDFAMMLKSGLTFEEFSDRIDAMSSMLEYAPFWAQMQQVLEIRGTNVPGQKLTKEELLKFAMGLGPAKWEGIFQEVYATTQLEQVAGVNVVAGQAGETAAVDGYGLTRQALVKIINDAEALNPGFEVEKLTGQDYADIGSGLRELDLQYMQRYGLTTADYIRMRFGGPRSAETAELTERVVATQEAFYEPRAQKRLPQGLEQGQGVSQEQLPQSL